MNFRKAIAAAPIAALFAAMPAQAVIVTFASNGAGTPVYFQNGADTGGSASTGALFSVSAPGNTTPGSVVTSFSFTNIGIGGLVTNVPATFTLNATTSSPALNVGSFQQSGFSGSFSFTNNAAIQIGDTVYAQASNLLTATFTNANVLVSRQGTNGSFTSFNLPATFTSDFVDFGGLSNGEFAFSLSGISPILTAPDFPDSLNSFAATSGGSFASDPAPTPTATIAAVPEPATWAMLIAGFGMAGLGVRRAKRLAAI